MPLAAFNTSLVKNLLQLSTSNAPPTQERSRLFWSVHLLNIYYGSPTLIPSVSDYSKPPRYLTIETRNSSMQCPPLPQSSVPADQEVLPDVWSRTIRLFSIWGDIRLYIMRCFEGLTGPPWQPGSDFTILCGQLQDIEIGHPTELSYNAAKFADRSPEEIQQDWAQWLPWLRTQITYHAVHCVLNHPFLYSTEVSKQKARSNTFWKESSEKALRHCTWVSRLVRMAGEKGMELNDPFLAQAATIAATLHLYWTRTNDLELQKAALANFEICKGLVSQLASRWTVCRSLVSTASLQP